VLSCCQVYEQQVVVDCWPRHRPGEELFLGPLVQVRMPGVTKAALKLAGGEAGLFAGHGPEVIVNQPVKIAAPKSEDVYWYATGLAQMEERVGEIVDFIERWVLPLLEILRTPEELVAVHRSGDQRVMRERQWWLFIAAAERLQGRPREALAVLEEGFRAPALRTRYAVAFAALRGELEEGGN
jgi:hypothetical protein